MKVLVADDEELVRSTLKKIILHLGFEVIDASDGAAAWDEILRHRPQVVVSDWGMPELSGMDLCARVRQKQSGTYTYFILVTGTVASSEDYQKAFEKGVDDFLMKPIKAAEIGNRLMVAKRILGLTQRVHDLEAFVPICSYCKRIRRNDGAYESLETFVYKHSETHFSHGVCPECMATHLPNPTK